MLIKLSNNKKELVVDHEDVLMVKGSDKYDRFILYLKSDKKEERTAWYIDQSPYQVLEIVKKAARLSKF